MRGGSDDADQTNLDARNARFWSELCGTGLASSLGIHEHDLASLERFDAAYFSMYPYLLPYVRGELLDGKRVLEVGLGFGTLSQYLFENCGDYWGLDISPAPVEMVQERMRVSGKGNARQVLQGSALEIPFEAESFDVVVSIGCLHHTGSLQKAVDEVARVLTGGGIGVIMIYNAWSLRQFLFRIMRPANWLGSSKRSVELNLQYDANSSGEVAPHIDYTRPVDVRRLFRAFATVSYDIRNIDPLPYFWGRAIPRRLLLNNVGRILGLDLYVTAVK